MDLAETLAARILYSAIHTELRRQWCPRDITETERGTGMRTRWSQLAPLTGVIFVILLVVSAFLPGSPPNSDASGASVMSYAEAHKNTLTVSAILTGFSLFFGLFFYGQLRSYLRRVPAVEQLAAISFGGAVLFAAGGGVVGGTALALADSPSKLDPGAAQSLNVLSRDLPMILFVGLGVLMFAAGLAIIQSRSLPVWLGWAGIVLGVVAVLPLGSSRSSVARSGHLPRASR